MAPIASRMKSTLITYHTLEASLETVSMVFNAWEEPKQYLVY